VRWISLIGGVLVTAVVSTPALATQNLSCGGKRDTPDIELLVGTDYSVAKWSFYQKRQSILDNPALRWATHSSNQHIAVTASRKSGEVIARLRLTRGRANWVGTLIVGRRTYWIRCDGFG